MHLVILAALARQPSNFVALNWHADTSGSMTCASYSARASIVYNGLASRLARAIPTCTVPMYDPLTPGYRPRMYIYHKMIRTNGDHTHHVHVQQPHVTSCCSPPVSGSFCPY